MNADPGHLAGVRIFFSTRSLAKKRAWAATKIDRTSCIRINEVVFRLSSITRKWDCTSPVDKPIFASLVLKNSIDHTIMIRTISIGTGLLSLFLLTTTASAQLLAPEFVSEGYALIDLGNVPGVPANYGGLTIRATEPNTLYIGGAANQGGAAVYTIGLERDPNTMEITGFTGNATFFAAAPNIDGGLLFAPNGTMLYTRYSMNELGQLLPDATALSTQLGPVGVAASVGSLGLVPQGFPGEGGLIFASYNGSALYRVPYAVAIDGEF